MGIIDVISEHSDNRDLFFKNLRVVWERVDQLLGENFDLESAVLTISSIEEFLRIEINFFQKLFQANAIKIRDKNLNVIASLDFDALGLRSPSELTLGQLIYRYYAFSKEDGLKAELLSINTKRKELIHRLYENTNYLDRNPHHDLREFIMTSRSAAVRLHDFDDKVIKTFFEDLTRRTSS